MTNYKTTTNTSMTMKVHSSTNLYACFKGSLELAALKQLLYEKKKGTLMRANVADGMPARLATDKTYDGLTFLWRIVHKSTAQTNATLQLGKSANCTS
jgi:hypothetical protein